MAANDKNYGNRKVYVASGGGGASSSQTGAKKPQFQKMAKKEKASPLPKLLMFIEVLIIVGCIMSPVFIGRKDRANKNVDLDTADYLGKSVTKALDGDDSLHNFARRGADLIKLNNPDGMDSSMEYRILGFMEADNTTPTYFYVSQTVNSSSLDNIGNLGMRSKLREMGEEQDLSMKFNKGIYFNQWIIAVDKNCKVHIFAGGGCTLETVYITKTHNLKGAQGNRVYELYPDTDLSYRFLLSDNMNGWKY